MIEEEARKSKPKIYSGEKKPPETVEEKLRVTFWFIRTIGGVDEAERFLASAKLALGSLEETS